MKRSTAMLAGAATVALAAGAVLASPAMAEPIPAATSYADLLEPVPNAMERLAADDASQPARFQLAQLQVRVGPGFHHHHHHHHHHHNRWWYMHNGYYWHGGAWVMRPHHHHHHHHHW